MPRMQTNCPQCRQPVVAEIDQLFDMTVDPRAKQKLLSGTANFINCPTCGYEGNLSTPIVYHDPDKELLLTYFPPDLGLPVNEQEKMVGPIISKVMENLPQEKRKGYLFNPKTMLTMQTMIEKILEGDGITKEMLDAQQKKAKLIERLVLASPESQLEIIKEEEDQIDEEFFALLSRLIQLTSNQGDQNGVQKLSELQKTLVENTKAGREIEEKTKEIDAAMKSLQEASEDGLTREKLLDLIVEAPSETRLSMLVSLARQGLDYQFFELLTNMINETDGEERQRLETKREKVLDMTREMDQALQEEMTKARKQLDEIMDSSDIEQAMRNNLESITDYFVEIVRSEQELAKRTGDLGKIEKLQQISKVIDEVTAPPPEIQLIEQMLSFESDQELDQFFTVNKEKITTEFLQLMNNVIVQSEQQGQPKELIDRLQKVYRSTLKFLMRSNLNN